MKKTFRCFIFYIITMILSSCMPWTNHADDQPVLISKLFFGISDLRDVLEYNMDAGNFEIATPVNPILLLLLVYSIARAILWYALDQHQLPQDEFYWDRLDRALEDAFDDSLLFSDGNFNTNYFARALTSFFQENIVMSISAALTELIIFLNQHISVDTPYLKLIALGVTPVLFVLSVPVLLYTLIYAGSIKIGLWLYSLINCLVSYLVSQGSISLGIGHFVMFLYSIAWVAVSFVILNIIANVGSVISTETFGSLSMVCPQILLELIIEGIGLLLEKICDNFDVIIKIVVRAILILVIVWTVIEYLYMFRIIGCDIVSISHWLSAVTEKITEKIEILTGTFIAFLINVLYGVTMSLSAFISKVLVKVFTFML